MDDRRKIRQFDIRRERLAQQQAAADEVALEARTLAAMGYDADSICRDLDKAKTPYSRTYIEKLVEDEQARQGLRSARPQDDAEDPVLLAVFPAQPSRFLAIGTITLLSPILPARLAG